MGKEWVQGRHCEFKTEFEDIKVGVKAWIYKVSKETVTFLTKQDQEPALKEVSFPSDEAEKFVNVKPGKPRDNFTALFEGDGASKPKKSTKKDPEVESILKATLERIASKAS